MQRGWMKKNMLFHLGRQGGGCFFPGILPVNPAERFRKAKRREIKSPCHAFTHSRDFIRASSGCHQAEASSCSCHSYRSAAMASALQAVGSGKRRGTAPAQQGPPRTPRLSGAPYRGRYEAAQGLQRSKHPLSHTPKTGMAERAKCKAVRRRGSVL